MKTRYDRFQRGSGLYVCKSCGKKTRETSGGEGGTQLCRRCFDKSSQENAHSDHHEGAMSNCPECRAEAKRGGWTIDSPCWADHKETKPVKKTFKKAEAKTAKPTAQQIKNELRAKREAKLAAKKDAAKTSAKFTPAVLGGFARWRDEHVSLADLAGQVGIKRSKLRRIFTELAGGKAKFRELRKAGAGGERKIGVAGVSVPKPDDSQLLVIREARTADGWKLKPRAHGSHIMVAPDGTEYVMAGPTERADLLYERQARSGFTPVEPVIRLRRLDGSPIVRKERKQDKLVERGMKAHKARRAAKKLTRQLRKGGTK